MLLGVAALAKIALLEWLYIFKSDYQKIIFYEIICLVPDEVKLQIFQKRFLDIPYHFRICRDS